MKVTNKGENYKFRNIKTEKGEYLVKVGKYGSEAFKCSIYVKHWMFFKKVHEKVFNRKLGGNSASEMVVSTINDYEHSRLTV